MSGAVNGNSFEPPRYLAGKRHAYELARYLAGKNHAFCRGRLSPRVRTTLGALAESAAGCAPRATFSQT
jgi:hypothetical protein